eukprot:UN11799
MVLSDVSVVLDEVTESVIEILPIETLWTNYYEENNKEKLPLCFLRTLMQTIFNLLNGVRLRLRYNVLLITSTLMNLSNRMKTVNVEY